MATRSDTVFAMIAAGAIGVAVFGVILNADRGTRNVPLPVNITQAKSTVTPKASTPVETRVSQKSASFCETPKTICQVGADVSVGSECSCASVQSNAISVGVAR